MSEKTVLAHWESTLFQLPDTLFFEIVKNYLGPLKTPFNKHSIINTLIVFLQKEETQRRIITLLDDRDRELIYLVLTLGVITIDDVITFFKNERKYLDIHRHLINLEERLILYRNRETGPQEIRVNPLLIPALKTDDGKTGFISWQPIPEHGPSAPLPWFSDQLSAAFLSFLFRTPALYRSDGKIRKKTEKELARRIPALLSSTPIGHRLTLLTRVLTRCGLIEEKECGLYPSFSRWIELGKVERQKRHLYLWTKAVVLLLASMGVDIMEKEAYRFLHSFFSVFPSNALLDGENLQKVIKLLLITCGIRNFDAAVIIRPLEILGLLVPSARADEAGPPKGYRRTVLPGEDEAKTGFMRQKGEPPLIVQPNFVLTLKPWTALETALPTALIAELVQLDIYPRYELKKESFLRGIENGYTADEIVDYLERNSNTRLPQNIAFSLDQWEREFSNVTLYEGFVLTVEKEMQKIIEHSDALQPYIKATLAPGVYLLSHEEKSEWSRVLLEMGIRYLVFKSGSDGVAKKEQKNEFQAVLEQFGSGQSGSALKRDRIEIGQFEISSEPAQRARPSCKDALEEKERLQCELLTVVKELDLPEETTEEYRARIEKKLILFPNQIYDQPEFGGKEEAKGLDYMGKVRLIEYALRNPDTLLEIIERTAEGKPKHITIQPEALVRSGNDLRLRGVEIPDGKGLSLRVEKMSLVRRVRGSLLG